MFLKMLKIILFGLVVLATVLGGIAVILNRSGESTWTKYARDAEQRGVGLHLDDYLQPPVDDAENFASTPLIAQLFAERPAGTPEPPTFAWKTPENGIAASDPATGKRVNLAEWQQWFIKSEQLPPDAAGLEPATAILQALEQFKPQLEELRQASKRPHSRFPVQWERGFAALLPHLAPIRIAGTINALQMEAHIARKDGAAAYENFEFGVRLVRSLQNEPVLISGLVRSAMLRTLLHAVWSGQTAGVWDAPTLERLQLELGRFDWLKDWQFSMNSERGALNMVIEDLARGGVRHRTVMLRGVMPDSGASTAGLALMPPGWIRENQVLMNQHADAEIKRIDVEREVFVSTEETSAHEDVQKSPVGKLRYALASTLTPAYQSVTQRFLAIHTATEQAQTACALERYRLAKGAYPATLQELVPAFLSKLPNDVIDGAPLRYRRESAGGYVLYSVAMNEVDENGEGAAANAREAKDWVWRSALVQ